MNRLIVVALFAPLMIAAALAQEAGKSAEKSEPSKAAPSPDQRMRATAERLTRELKLTKPQQAKLAELMEAQRKQTASFRELTVEIFKAAGAKDTKRLEQLQAQLKQFRSAEGAPIDRLYAQLEPLLTAEQKTRLQELRRPRPPAAPSPSRRQRVDKASLKQLRAVLKLTDSQGKQFDELTRLGAKGNVFDSVESILDTNQKKILSRYRARYMSTKARTAGIRGILRAAERLDLDVKQQREMKHIKKTARQQLARLRGGDELASDYEDLLEKKVGALLRPAQLERFQRMLSGNKKLRQSKRGLSSQPAKKP